MMETKHNKSGHKTRTANDQKTCTENMKTFSDVTFNTPVTSKMGKSHKNRDEHIQLMRSSLCKI